MGSSLAATLYAINNNLPIFFTEGRRPFRFDYFAPHIDLSCVKIHKAVKSLNTPQGQYTVGPARDFLWERLLFLLSLCGNAPVLGLAHTLRYDGSRLVCSNEYSKILELSFERCIYFGDNNSFGFTQQKKLANEKYTCYDYIAFNKGGKHEIDYISTTDEFVSEVWFYPSDRIDGNTGVKDACVVSNLSHTQLLEFDYSETMARFKMISEMESLGMKGLFNGYTTNGKPKHYKFQTTHITRQTNSSSEISAPSSDCVEIAQVSEKDLLSHLPDSLAPYNRFLKYL